MSVNEQLKRSIEEASKLSQEALLAELGRQLEAIEQERDTSNTLSAAVAAVPPPDQSALGGPFADKFKQIARRFLDRYNRMLFGLFCDPKDEDGKAVQAAMTQSAQAAGLVLAGVLLAHFAWLPGIVALVVSLVMKRFINETWSVGCKLWREQLGDEDEPARSHGG